MTKTNMAKDNHSLSAGAMPDIFRGVLFMFFFQTKTKDLGQKSIERMLPSTCFQSCYSLLFCEHECPHLTVFTAFRIGHTQTAIIINFQTVKQVSGTHSLMRPASLPHTANANLSQPVSAPLHTQYMQLSSFASSQ